MNRVFGLFKIPLATPIGFFRAADAFQWLLQVPAKIGPRGPRMRLAPSLFHPNEAAADFKMHKAHCGGASSRLHSCYRERARRRGGRPRRRGQWRGAKRASPQNNAQPDITFFPACQGRCLCSRDRDSYLTPCFCKSWSFGRFRTLLTLEWPVSRSDGFRVHNDISL